MGMEVSKRLKVRPPIRVAWLRTPTVALAQAASPHILRATAMVLVPRGGPIKTTARITVAHPPVNSDMHNATPLSWSYEQEAP